jgi:hypothetical protein
MCLHRTTSSSEYQTPTQFQLCSISLSHEAIVTIIDFSDTESCSATEVYRRFGGPYSVHHHGDYCPDDGTSQTWAYFNETTRHYIREDYYLHSSILLRWSQSNSIIPTLTLWSRERERDGKDRRRVDSKRKSRDKVRDSWFCERGERASLCSKVPRLHQLVLLVGVLWTWRRYGDRGWLQTAEWISDCFIDNLENNYIGGIHNRG